jgi:hypothetical protein
MSGNRRAHPADDSWRERTGRVSGAVLAPRYASMFSAALRREELREAATPGGLNATAFFSPTASGIARARRGVAVCSSAGTFWGLEEGEAEIFDG